jgi:hypothetical protein
MAIIYVHMYLYISSAVTLTLCSPDCYCELQQSGPHGFLKKSQLLNSEAAVVWKMLNKTNINHCKITRRFELDTGPGKMESSVECNSTLDRYVLRTCAIFP